MDILDIIVARKLSTGAAAAIERSANEAIQEVTDASTMIEDTVAAAEAANQAAEAANEKMQSVLESYESLVSDVSDAVMDDVDEKLADAVTDVTSEDANTDAVKVRKVKVRKKSLENALEMVKNYTSTGDNEDGSMTQKAITAKFDEIAQQLAEGTAAASLNLGAENAGAVVVIGSDGNIIPSTVSEEELVDALMNSDSYSALNAVGLTIDYANRTFERIQEAKNYSAGTDFDKYPMYGGRRRCNVDLNGRIIAWYGEPDFKDDGSNGDVMVYQPKFYYRRIPLTLENIGTGSVVRKESIVISATKQVGFKVHPAFLDENHHEVNYILLPAYDSCYYDVSTSTVVRDDSGVIDFAADRLLSYGDAKPVSGNYNHLTVTNAEQMARNRGTGWHIMTMPALSATQMLAMVELGTMNGQAAIELGVSNITNVNGQNCSSQTGSTASLGNKTGVAASTTNIINGVATDYDTNGYRAITYRGMENPWGNIWQLIGDVNIYGTGANNGGIPYICTDFNYTHDSIGDNYASVGFTLPSVYGWISGMGYGEEAYDWVYMPAECIDATSALPVGDSLWTNARLNGTNIVMYGGTSTHEAKNGLFYYGCDKNSTIYERNVSARIIHIPIYNTTIHDTNYNSWLQQTGG